MQTFKQDRPLQGGNETEIMLRARYSGYGGMKLDPKVVEKR